MTDFPRKYYSLDKLDKDEEFSNFMVKVNEVSGIIKKLASKDQKVAEIGDLEAKQYLDEPNEEAIKNIDTDSELKVRCNRTVINKKAIENMNKDPNTMSQEAFMRGVEKDAEQRYQDKLVRTEKMETFKKQATLAFRRGEYEKALTLYNKAIEQIKDSILLYNNRALTCINLKLYDKAEKDLKDWAFHLNEDCLRTWLLLAKVHFLQNRMDDYRNDIKEALERNPGQKEFIEDFMKKLETEKNTEQE